MRRLFNAAAASLPGAIYPGDLPGMYFHPDGDPPAPVPTDPPPATPPAPPSADPPADPPAPSNQEAAWRRKAEASEKRVKELEKAEQDRKDAELGELDREKKQRGDAETRAAAAEAKVLKLEIAAELGVPAEALDLLTGADEATIRAQAEKIVAITGKSGGQAAPIQAGGRTQPTGGAQPTADEKIAAAMKSGDSIAAIRLMREKQGIAK